MRAMTAPVATAARSTAAPSPNAFTSGTIYRIGGWQWLLFWPPALGLDLYLKSLRLSMPEADQEAIKAATGPRIFVVWHNRSLLTPLMLSPPIDRSKVYALISASKAAAWEVAFFEHWGIPAIRGSSTRRSIQAVREMLAALKNGDDLILSPDGPKGPVYSFQKGALMVARKSDAQIVLLTANATRARRLKTWDRHLVPYPFSKIELRADVVGPYSQLGAKTEEEASALLRRRALELSEE
jgi:hypothetical protein